MIHRYRPLAWYPSNMFKLPSIQNVGNKRPPHS